MWIRVEGGGQKMWIGFLYLLGLFRGSKGHFNAYSVVFGLFQPKTEDIKNQPTKVGEGGAGV